VTDAADAAAAGCSGRTDDGKVLHNAPLLAPRCSVPPGSRSARSRPPPPERGGRELGNGEASLRDNRQGGRGDTAWEAPTSRGLYRSHIAPRPLAGASRDTTDNRGADNRGARHASPVSAMRPRATPPRAPLIPVRGGDRPALPSWVGASPEPRAMTGGLSDVGRRAPRANSVRFVLGAARWGVSGVCLPLLSSQLKVDSGAFSCRLRMNREAMTSALSQCSARSHRGAAILGRVRRLVRGAHCRDGERDREARSPTDSHGTNPRDRDLVAIKKSRGRRLARPKRRTESHG
ncbi:hypothetical protein THAOC_18651, partial [Thalassiosira oceanica]